MNILQDAQLQHDLMQANLYGLLAKRYEYVDPQRHIHFYLKHFEYVKRVEDRFMMLQNGALHPFYQVPTPTMMV